MKQKLLLLMLFVLTMVCTTKAQLVYPGSVDTLTGEQMIFDFSTQGVANDYPDAPARAFRDASGRIQLMAAHYDAYRMTGPDFDHLTRDYANGRVYTSSLNGTYSNFNQNTWIHSPYTTDGVNIHSLNHNEFNGATPSNWHNAITYALSTDTGKTYTQSASPAHLVWSLPYNYTAGQGPCGYFAPSNIVYNSADGFYYSMIHIEHRGVQATGVGVIRTSNLSDPTSWRGWDGTGFNATLGNPYAPGFTGVTGHTLAVVNDLNDNVGTMSESLTFNTYFNQWMLIGSCSQSINGTTVYGFYYSLSSDLIHWSFRKLIKQMPVAWASSTYPKVLYPSLIDHTDTSRNFTYTGQEAYLYYTKQNSNTDRDLVRIKIRFNKNTVTPTFTVNTTTDNTSTAVDANYGDGTAISKIAGNTSVTLRSAILEANARPAAYYDSVYTINFNIPGGGAQTITLSAALPEIKYPLLIDGYSQPGSSVNTAAFGSTNNAAIKVNLNLNSKSGILVNGTGTTVKGLAIYNQSDAAVLIYDGHHNAVKGCYLGVPSSGLRTTTYPKLNLDGIDIGGTGSDASPSNTIGGTDVADQNIILGGIYIRGAASRYNLIYGNYIGTDITGDTAIDRNEAGVYLYDSASYNSIGGAQTAMGNLISGNNTYGIMMTGAQTSYNTVENNYLGVASDLQTSLDNGSYEVRIAAGAHHNRIGTPSGGNVIGTASTALVEIAASPSNYVQNNIIGTDASQTSDLGTTNTAIRISGNASNNNYIGGTGTDEGNVIANSVIGIATLASGYGNRFLSNTFPGLEELAVDLKNDGMSNNDNLDTDGSAAVCNNYLQNFPEMFDADSVSGGVRICGELNSNPNDLFTLQFFKSVNNTTSGFGAAEELIGSMQVSTGTTGVVQFSTVITHPNVHVGEFISVSATDSVGNSSEIGENWAIGDGTSAAPTFIWLSNTSVAENLPSGTVVGILTPQDPDLCDTHTFSLASGAQATGNSSFTIVGNELRTTQSFNYEAQNVYNVRFRVTDQSGAYYEKPYPINVTNVNEAPTSLNLNPMSVAEGQPVGTNVGTLSSVDPDPGTTTFTYTLVSGVNSTDNALFTIVGSQLKTNAILNSNTNPQCHIRIRTTDAGGQYYENPFTVNVTGGINDAPTAISRSATSLPENLTANTTVATLAATDPDVGDTHTFSLVSGAGSTNNALFNISGANLRASSSVDFETVTSLSVRLRATDAGGLTFDTIMTFAVTNVNEAPSNLSAANPVLVENQATGTAVATLSAVDADAGDSHTYSFVAGSGSTHNAMFSLSNGQLSTAAVFDYESTPVVSIRIRATDAGGLYYEKALSLTVTNANDAPTDLSASAVAIAENQNAGTSLGTLTTTDQDVADTHVYSLVSGLGDTDNALFAVSGTSLQSNAVFNYEQQQSYSIRLRSTDSQGQYVEKVITPTVSNVNEAPYAFLSSADSIAENEAIGTAISNLSCSDVDAGDSHTYSLVSGLGSADNASFSISGGDLLSAASFDYETKNTYYIRVRSTDAGGLYVDSALVIRVTDVSESTTGLNDQESEAELAISPNPATAFVQLKSKGQIQYVGLYNLLGAEVFSVQLDNVSEFIMPCSGIIQGVYTLRVKFANNQLEAMKKLIIRK